VNSQIEGLDLVIARLFPHMGPSQSKQFVCSDWAGQIAAIEAGNKPLAIVVGNLEVVTDYCDVGDVVKAYFLLLNKGKKSEVYNISTGRPISLKEILNILLKEARVKETIKIKEDLATLRKLDQLVRLGKNTKIRKNLDWKPEIPIAQSLHDLLDYWRQNS
jgi:GDP-4-dehydro-6-deoxy-D-mannose reductase